MRNNPNPLHENSPRNSNYPSDVGEGRERISTRVNKALADVSANAKTGRERARAFADAADIAAAMHKFDGHHTKTNSSRESDTRVSGETRSRSGHRDRTEGHSDRTQDRKNDRQTLPDGAMVSSMPSMPGRAHLAWTDRRADPAADMAVRYQYPLPFVAGKAGSQSFSVPANIQETFAAHARGQTQASAHAERLLAAHLSTLPPDEYASSGRANVFYNSRSAVADGEPNLEAENDVLNKRSVSSRGRARDAFGRLSRSPK